MDVTDWLRSLGLDRYAAAFRENEVSADLLAKLTAQDLQELGVAAVGHRRRLLEAIAALRGDDGPAGGRAEPAQAERRHLTVLFCDLVGSTPLSTRLDPEDLRQFLDTYRAAVVAAVTSKRGYVAKYLGDGVLAYFGWPNADEAHADSAVRAGLAAVEAVRPHQLSARVGIATGLVVVGDLIGTGAAQEHPAIGETPNLAARLQVLAEPDTIVVSDATRAQLGRMFDLEELGPVALKGFEKPVRAWRARGEAGASSRSEALYGGAVTPLVGRDEELGLLLRRWRQAKAGEGRVVLLSGEAGIGKSRLLAALEEKLTGEPHVSLRYFCSPHHQESALYPITARLEQEAGFVRGDTAEDRLVKLETVLAPTKPAPEDVPLLAALLSIRSEGRYPGLEMSPLRRKERTLAALLRRLANFAAKEPVLILFEDAHWSDPTSLELLDAVIEQVAALPVLLVISFRPDFAAPWFGRPGVSLLALNRLDRRDATALASQVVTDHALPSTLLDRIVVQADGVPLFIEELTKAVLETAGLDTSATLAVPDTLQASLMARLDRLPTGKQVAQIGSVLGREFSHVLLTAIAEMPEPLLAQGLDELVASGLAFRRGTPPDAVYAFKHALVQDVAYESLLRSRRAGVHGKIAEILQRDGNAGSKLALIGYHCANAGLIENAALCYRSAGERLSEGTGFVETENLLRRGLVLAESLPESPRRGLLEAELWVTLAATLALTKGGTHPDTGFATERSVESSRRHDDLTTLSRALYLRSYHRMQRGDHAAGWDDARELLEVNEKSGFGARSVGHVMLIFSSLLAGRFEAARVNAHTARELGSHAVDDASLILGVLTVEVVSWLFSTFSLGCLGHVEQAAAEYARAFEQAGRLGPSGRAVLSVQFPRLDLLVFRDETAFQEHTGAFSSLATELGLSQFVLVARLNQGWLAVRAGEFEEGVTEMRAALEAMHAIDYLMWIPCSYFLLADALTFSGRDKEALACLREGLALTACTGEAWLDAELHRLAGESLLKCNQPNSKQGGEQELGKAIAISRGQSAKLFELRAATSLARFWSGQGRRAEARDLLAPVYDWFTEGFGSVDLREARAVMAELGEPRPLH